ncbi:MAG: hypothetical protein GY727_16690, partial [Gammaproteobacteria bacterium]|nr:hypothetical protein [Gammaproteobacteria bacterium]
KVLTSDVDGLATWAYPASGTDGDWTISGSDMYSAVAGNVGIGTTSPAYKLDIAGGANAVVRITGDGTTGGTFVSEAGSGLQLYKDNVSSPTKAASVSLQIPGNSVTDDLIFSTWNTTSSWVERLRILNSNGNVGIGISTPTASLHVVNTGSVNIPGHNVQTAASNSNTFLGYNTGNTTMTGTSNTAMGQGALNLNTTGASNSALGRRALFNTTTGSYNTAFGSFTLFNNDTGNDNTAFGRTAGYNNISGSGNVFLGKEAGYNETGS